MSATIYRKRDKVQRASQTKVELFSVQENKSSFIKTAGVEISYKFPRHQGDAEILADELLNVDPVLNDLMPAKVISVLVVDDDAEATVPIECIFRGLGCLTDMAFCATEAIEKIATGWHDVIVLDWTLDLGTGGDLIERLLENRDHLDWHDHRAMLERQRIVTYSGTRAGEIKIPHNDIFAHVDHWRKPLKYTDISKRASQLLVGIGV